MSTPAWRYAEIHTEMYLAHASWYLPSFLRQGFSDPTISWLSFFIHLGGDHGDPKNLNSRPASFAFLAARNAKPIIPDSRSCFNVLSKCVRAKSSSTSSKVYECGEKSQELIGMRPIARPCPSSPKYISMTCSCCVSERPLKFKALASVNAAPKPSIVWCFSVVSMTSSRSLTSDEDSHLQGMARNAAPAWEVRKNSCPIAMWHWRKKMKTVLRLAIPIR
mmetsp:Transcript_86486/g.242096  ORF Transcript_86486/g.242096 Transcript_86486/m.242096 type:complete len:220 (-) Transcript_86486:166-825(-)